MDQTLRSLQIRSPRFGGWRSVGKSPRCSNGTMVVISDRTHMYHESCIYPKGSMYGIFSYIYHKNEPNVGKYTIHGSYGYVWVTSTSTTQTWTILRPPLRKPDTPMSRQFNLYFLNPNGGIPLLNNHLR